MKTWDKTYISGPDMVFKYDMHIKQDYEISNMILRMIIRQTSLSFDLINESIAIILKSF